MPDRTVLGPLTTTFTYPSSCSVVVKDCLTCERGYQAQTCGTNPSNGQGVQDDPDCWPERSNNDLTTGFAFNGWGIYSPGIHCPDGYTTACAATAGIDGGFPFQYSLEKSETAIGCCPRYATSPSRDCRPLRSSPCFLHPLTVNPSQRLPLPICARYRRGTDLLPGR